MRQGIIKKIDKINMDSDIVIKVEGLHKKFCRNLRRSMFYGTLDVARDMVGIARDRGKLRPSEFFALEDINFELKKGEALGIIGQNGSGKTTLLRIINGIFPPDRGKISVRGRIGALIAVGAGFHPHMTGRENIYLNGTILGMTRKEIDAKFQEIIDFADIGEFIDAPVSTYSSGMTVRLGFSIAITSSPEILLADEALAVGDLSFALKCYKKIAEYREAGGSIILVSHAMQLIRNTCNKVLWIDKGVVVDYGDVQKIADKYEKKMFDKLAKETSGKGTHINTDPLTLITKVELLNQNDEVTENFESGGFFKLRIFFDCKRKVEKPIFTFSVLTPESVGVISNYSNDLQAIEGEGVLDVVIEKLIIKAGSYSCSVTLSENNPTTVLDWHERSFNFNVIGNNNFQRGLAQISSSWEIK